MPARNPARRRAAAVVGALSRDPRSPDDPRMIEAQRDLAAERLHDYVRRIVDTAPPLTAEQRDRIAALLRPGVSEIGAVSRAPSDDGGGAAA